MIRIILDSASDYQLEECRQNNIDLVPISVTLNGTTYQDGVDLDRDHFYQTLIATKEFPRTSQPSPQSFLDIFEDAMAQPCETIISLRKEMTAKVAACAQEKYASISGRGYERFEMKYACCIQDTTNITDKTTDTKSISSMKPTIRSDTTTRLPLTYESSGT